MRTLILGSGPAGLFAAHAASVSGSEIMIMSKPRKSFMRGAQYLHRPIPGLSSEQHSFIISYEMVGDIEGYKRKVYGNTDLRGKKVSPEDFLGHHEAWDIRVAYDAAWDLYGDGVLPLELTGESGEIAALTAWAGADMVISTVPAPLLCENRAHTFGVEMVWVTDTAHAVLGHENVVLCSGEKDHAWYRQSNIQGWMNTEYPHDNKPPVSNLWEVQKPVMNNCDCYPDIHRAGRYGLWEKGVLSDGAFYSVREEMEKV